MEIIACSDEKFVLQVVPSYEHGELILKNYRESLSESGAAPGDDPNASEVLPNKEVVYSEVCFMHLHMCLHHKRFVFWQFKEHAHIKHLSGCRF